MKLHASTGSGEADVVSDRLAEVLTVVSSVAVLSEVSGSNTPEVVFQAVDGIRVGTVTGVQTCALPILAPLVIVVRFHPTTPAVRVPTPLAETKLVPAGIASDKIGRASCRERV